MTALLFGPDGPVTFTRGSLSADFPEKHLQGLLFDNPALLPLNEIDPGSGGFVPLCRELPIPRTGRRVFLDILGVTLTGKLVLVECKLWRNPQARREVVAQILEYASLLRRWTFSDLTARMKSFTGAGGANPVFDRVVADGTMLDEAAFTDAVSRSLRTGIFTLSLPGMASARIPPPLPNMSWTGARGWRWSSSSGGGTGRATC